MPQPSGYEPWMRDVVEDVYRSTFPPMLTLRCAETADILADGPRRASCARAQRFGSEERMPGAKAQGDSDRGEWVRRGVEVHFATPRFPKGVPIGVRYTGKYQKNAETGDKTFVVVSTSYDISIPQVETLKELAEGRPYPSDADRARSRQLVAAAEVNARREKMDPVGTEERKAVTLAKAMVAAGVGQPAPAHAAPPSAADIPDEEFEREAARRRMAKARAAKGAKAKTETEETVPA